MTINDTYCNLLDFDFGYDNQALANKIEKISDEFAIAFYEWRSTCLIKNIDQYTNKEALEIFKKAKDQNRINTNCCVCGSSYSNPNNDSDTCYDCIEPLFR